MIWTEKERQAFWERNQVIFAEKAHEFFCCDIPTLVKCKECDVNPLDCDNKVEVLKLEKENAELKARLKVSKDIEDGLLHNQGVLLKELSELREAANKELILMYNRGYRAGHADTVEGEYVDILDVDMPTYHSDVVEEILEDQ